MNLIRNKTGLTLHYPQRVKEFVSSFGQYSFENLLRFRNGFFFSIHSRRLARIFSVKRFRGRSLVRILPNSGVSPHKCQEYCSSRAWMRGKPSAILPTRHSYFFLTSIHDLFFFILTLERLEHRIAYPWQRPLEGLNGGSVAAARHYLNQLPHLCGTRELGERPTAA